MSDEPILKQAQDKLKPFEPKLLDAFSRVFARKRPPQSMRALAPLAMVLMLEAFGLAFLLNREIVRLAILAARGPGKGDDDLLDDSDEMAAIRWAAARHDAIDRAYSVVARDLHKNASTGLSFVQWIKAGYGPNRAVFEQQWGQRNPIDPTTAPKCFDPSAQLSILDAVGHGDGYLGAFVSTSFLTSSAPKQITCMGQSLDLEGCETLDVAASRAVLTGWVAYLDHRGVVMGLRLIPRTDGVQTRLRAPLANIVAMYADDSRDAKIADLETRLANMVENHNSVCEQRDALQSIDQQWQIATGASDPEMAAELTRQRIEQIADLKTQLNAAKDTARMVLPTVVDSRAVTTTYPDGHTEIVVDESNAQSSKFELSSPKETTVPRMIWPDQKHAPSEISCANAIAAHRRGEFIELAFSRSRMILENVRAWLAYYDMCVRDPSPDATGYCTCAIGTGGNVPPKWADMKQRERDSFPGFVLFAPDGSAKVVFCAKEPSAKPGKPRSKKAKS